MMDNPKYDKVNDAEAGIANAIEAPLAPCSTTASSIDINTGNEGTSASASRMSPLMKAALVIFSIAAIAGLSAGLGSRRVNRSPSNTTSSPDPDPEPEPPLQVSRLTYFGPSVLAGYAQCEDLQADIEEAVELMTNIMIDNSANSKFHNTYSYVIRGGDPPPMMSNEGDVVMMEATEGSDTTPDKQASSDTSASGESSFGTNNQVDGVDEADLVKSDGTHVFAAYGDKLIVWDALSGTELSRTTIPTEDENGIQLCQDIKYNSETVCYTNTGYGWWAPVPISIASLMLHGNRLTIVASTSFALQNDYPVLKNGRNTRIFVYDALDIPTDGVSPLTLLARKDLQGSYQTARSIGQNAHIVTSSNLNSYHHLDNHLYPWIEAFVDMDEETYRAAALLVAQEKGPEFAANLTSELIAIFDYGADEDCSKISKVAIMLKESLVTMGDESATSGFRMLPSFTDSSVLKTLTQVYSLNLAQEFNKVNNTVPITTSSSGVFFPTTSYTTNVYASAEKLVVAGESYVEDDDGHWNEHTILLVYDLQGDASVPAAVGDVPGSLLNQFSMDHYQDPDTNENYLRVATTSWGRWGVGEDDMWQQIEESKSQVSVLRMPNAGDDSTGLEMVGNATGIGLGERIYAARFIGERAYVVTFRLVDPFYTLNMTDPTNPIVVGELKVPGYSNYLHPVSDDLILALGRDATEKGMVNGLQISLFNVSDFENPVRVNQYVEDSEGSSSAAEYDHKAFRYLPESKLLILPLYIDSWYSQQQEYFDGFVVYDVDETRDFSKKFNISHVDGKDAQNDGKYCWGAEELPSRSLVFEGTVTTLKGHTALSHNLDTENLLWKLNLDMNRHADDTHMCSPWHGGPIFMF